MSAVQALIGVLILVLLVFLGVGLVNLDYLFGVIVPYAAVVIFLSGIVYRIIKWARSPVPFCITTTCGQQKSLKFIKPNNLETPHNKLGLIGRMLLEVLTFRSLFRNTKVDLKSGPKLVYGSSKWLWLGALAFHWSFLVIFMRHFRYFIEPIPSWVTGLLAIDGFFKIGVPEILVTDIIILAALTFLFLRRIVIPQMRYLSLSSDYFPLFLILGIAISGVLMRHFLRVDIVEVKNLAMGLVNFNPIVSEKLGLLFFIHLFLVSVLFAYFPFSKLLHMPGVFLSPSRNMTNNSRIQRHVNPWNYPVKVHTYQEWEDEFRDKIKAFGLPLEKEEE